MKPDIDIYHGSNLKVAIISDWSNINSVDSEKDEYLFYLLKRDANQIILNNEAINIIDNTVIGIQPNSTIKLPYTNQIKIIFSIPMKRLENTTAFQNDYIVIKALHPQIVLLLKEFIIELKHDNKKLESIYSALEEIIITRFNQFHRYDNAAIVPTLYSNEVRVIIEFMHHNIHRKITINDIAKDAKISVRTLNTKFKSEVGKPPITYLNKLRFERAKRMLELGNESMTDIAIMCGFGDSSYFASRFKKMYRISPKHYRNQMTKRSKL